MMPREIRPFGELPVGARFEFRGRRYQKLALSLAWDEERCGNVFQDGTEVLPEPGTPRPAPGERRAPADPAWVTHLSPAPGQVASERYTTRPPAQGPPGAVSPRVPAQPGAPARPAEVRAC